MILSVKACLFDLLCFANDITLKAVRSTRNSNTGYLPLNGKLVLQRIIYSVGVRHRDV